MDRSLETNPLATSRLNRRYFLQLAAATAAAIGCTRLVSASERVPLTKPIPMLWCLAASLLQFGLGDRFWVLPALAIPFGLLST